MSRSPRATPPSASPEPPRAALSPSWTALGLALLAVARVALHLQRLTRDPLRYRSWEESINAGNALAFWEAGLWDHALDLQYKAFCGGCSVASALGAPLMGLGGDRLLTWKLLPMAWGVATTLAAWWAARRLAGPAAGWGAALLLALAPAGLADVGLMAWGNHWESGLWVLVALGLAATSAPARPGRGAALGLLIGLSVWAARAATPGALVALAIGVKALSGRGRLALLLGLGVGLSPLLLPASLGDAGRYELLSIDLTEILPRALLLLSPAELGARLSPGGGPNGGLASGWLWLGAMALAAGRLLTERRWGLPAWALLFAAAFCVAPVQMPPLGPRAEVLALRYLAPWVLIGALLIGAGAGRWWAGGQRLVALTLLGAGLLTAAEGRLRPPPLYSGERVPLAELPALDGPRAAVHLASRLSPTRLAEAAEALPLAALAYGVQGGLRVADEDLSREEALDLCTSAPRPELALHGLGLALVGPGMDTNDRRAAVRWLEGLPEHQRGVSAGMAQALGMSLLRQPPRPGDPRRQTQIAVDTLCAPPGCPLSSGAGAVMARACGGLGERVAPELERCMRDLSGELGPELLRGAGLVMAGRLLDDSRREALSLSLGAEMEAGLSHPAAGMVAPAVLGALEEQPRLPWR